MNPEKAIEILTIFNRWRRAKPPYDKPGAMLVYGPVDIGEAIDTAIDAMHELRELKEALGEVTNG